MSAPCKDCPNRYPRCHTECKAYIAYSRERIELNRARYAEREIMSDNKVTERKRKMYWDAIMRKR